MDTATKCQLYATLSDYDKYQAAYSNRKYTAQEKHLDRINSDIGNEVERRKKQGYIVTPRDAYHWKRNMILIESGPHHLGHVLPYSYDSQPYKTQLLQSPAQPTASVVAISPPSLSFDQIIQQDSRYPAVKDWLARQLALKTPGQVMCASCKACDTGGCHCSLKNECNCKGQQCRCLSWEIPVSISLIERVEQSIRRHKHKRRRTQTTSPTTQPAVSLPASNRPLPYSVD